MEIDESETTELKVASSYLEDGELQILVVPKCDDKDASRELRWRLSVDPQTRHVLRVEFCIATNDGFEYPPYTPSSEQMDLFRQFAKECQS
jgi:hypothetical protein